MGTGTAIAIAIITGVLSGLGSGALAAWLQRPAASAAAEEIRLRTRQRRDIVAAGRQLVADATAGGWEPQQVSKDRRFMALRPHLEGRVLDRYEPGRRRMVATLYDDSVQPYGDLLDGIDHIEETWKLV